MVFHSYHGDFLGPVIPGSYQKQAFNQKAGTYFYLTIFVDWNKHFFGIHLNDMPGTYITLTLL